VILQPDSHPARRASVPRPEKRERRAAAVVVSLNPPGNFEARVCALVARFERIFLIDNGSDPVLYDAVLDRLGARRGVQLLRNGRNRGIAAALNQGMEAARAAGFGWALLLDHDSVPAADMVALQFRALARWPEPDRVAVLVPSVRCVDTQRRWRWPRAGRSGIGRFRFVYSDRQRCPIDVDIAIGSGMLVHLGHDRLLGGMREDLFVDAVDIEYCLRVRDHGLQIVAVPAAVLHHRLGAMSRRRIGRLQAFPTHHSPLRHYYIARNRVHLLRWYARRDPRWTTYEAMAAAKLAFKVALFERNRREKFRMMVEGLRDGLLGRTGARPET
jgi:rhamnosyltransferase